MKTKAMPRILVAIIVLALTLDGCSQYMMRADTGDESMTTPTAVPTYPRSNCRPRASANTRANHSETNSNTYPRHLT